MTIDHIGYAVRRMDRALSAFSALGYEFGPIVDDFDRNVKICLGEKDGYRIELVCPLDRKKASPVDVYLKNVGPAPYHICYRSDDLEKDMEDLASQGFRMILPPAEAVAFGGRRVAFLSSLGLGLMEIVEK